MYYTKRLKAMKGFILIGAVAAAAVCAPVAAEAVCPQVGVRLGMELTFPASDVYNTGAGVNTGLVARFDLPKRFFIEPGVMLSYSAMSSKDLITFDDDYFYEGAAKFYTIRVPVMVGYAIPLSPAFEMAVSTGPYVNFNLWGRQQLEPNLSAPDPLPAYKINLFDHGWKRVDAGWSIKLGVAFAKSYYVGVTGGVSFTPLARYGNGDKKVRVYRNTLAISLGYNF